MSRPSANNRLTARLVLHHDNKGWILEKFAVRLAENLPNWNVVADISDRPSRTAHINHWVLFMHCQGERWPNSTMAITHVDRPSQYRKLRAGMHVVDVGICMSRMMVDYLTRRGIPRENLCYITPAHDGVVSPRRIIIGITTRVYSDGRKREGLLLELAQSRRLDAFQFEIFGDGWETVIPHLKSAGATVGYYPGSGDHEIDYKLTLERIPTFDYYLYTGWDEGSMGFLDALAAGVATIVTPQGFHLDIEGGITHAFENAAQLREIFDKISRERDSYIDSVKDLTWNEFARRHALVWRAILEGKRDELANLLPTPAGTITPLPKQSTLHRVLADTRFYGQPALNRFRRLLKRK